MKAVAFDTETKGLRWWDPNEQAFLATWANEHGEYHADLSDEAETERFISALREADVILAHNLPFDTHQVRETLGLDILQLGAELHDTHIESKVLYPEGQRRGAAGGHSLKNLATVFLKADAAAPEDAIKEMAKSIGLRTIKQTGAYHQVWLAYPEVMEKYARQDARYTFDLHDKWSSSMGDLKRVYDLEMAVMPVLIRAEQRGIATDQAKVQELKTKFTAQREEVYDSLGAELGTEALGGEGSTDALTEALLGIGVPLYRKTDSGRIATHKFALAEFEKDFPVLSALEEFRRLEKFLATYIGPMDGVDVIHPSFSQLGAWTSRMSCRSPNLQNWPKAAGKEVRSVLVPRPGHAFVAADYEGIEARLLAYYLGDDGYRELYRSGHDPHAYMAAQIHGGRIEDYLKGTPGEALRAAAKNTMFAITYGAGAPRVADMNGISRDEAKALISKIKASLPGYYRLNKRIRDKIEREGYVSTIIGRKQVVSKDKSYVGLNALIQGSAAEIMKLGVVAVDEAVKPLGGVPVLFVHDEIVVEVPIELAEECQRRVEMAMCGAWDLDPPLSVESSISETSYADV